MVIQKSFTETIIKRFKMSVATVLALVHYHCHGMVHMSKKDSYVCSVKSMYKHILDVIDDAREDNK